ncbi:MAG: hypothetical protein ACLUI3_04115 [Christensenellales bacterium]
MIRELKAGKRTIPIAVMTANAFDGTKEGVRPAWPALSPTSAFQRVTTLDNARKA